MEVAFVRALSGYPIIIQSPRASTPVQIIPLGRYYSFLLGSYLHLTARLQIEHPDSSILHECVKAAIESPRAFCFLFGVLKMAFDWRYMSRKMLIA